MIRKSLSLIPLILLAACSRTENRPIAVQPTTAANPEPVEKPAQPVGYAPASAALKESAPAPNESSSAPATEVPENEAAGAARSVSAIVIPRGTPVHVRLDETIDT